MLSEFKPGQIVARCLREDMDEIATELNLFHSKIHDEPVNFFPKFQAFLGDMIQAECHQEIWQHLARTFFSEEIDQTVNRLDIWGDISNSNASTTVGKHALSEFASHCLTQHNNERLVELSALMAWVSYFCSHKQ
jgi:hypothetical protein